MNRELRPLPGAFAVGGGLNRRYSGTAGLTENYQVRVFLTHATGRVHTLSGRRLYLSASWTDDRERDRRAGTEDSRWRMVLRALLSLFHSE